MIVTLARGHYCPKEHQQHLELAAHQAKFTVAYTQIVTISTDVHHTLQEFRDSVGAHWPFLSDPGRTIQQDLDIQEYTDPEHDPMIPHTLVLKPGRVIHRIYNGYWFWGRPSFYELWRDLREVFERAARLGPGSARTSPGVGSRQLRLVPRLEPQVAGGDRRRDSSRGGSGLRRHRGCARRARRQADRPQGIPG